MEENGKKTAEKLCTDWQKRTLSATQTNEGTAALIQKGLLEGNPLQYLERYELMENAQSDEFLKILSDFIPDTPDMIISSVDSKN